MRIGIDFDRVLFDTEGFKEELESRFSRFSETYEQARDERGYHYKKHAEILGVNPEKILEELRNAESFLYSDISQLEKLDHNLIIVSRGDPKFQRKKIELSGVLKYVDDYKIVQKKDKGTAGIEFLVDDLKKEIERAGVPGFHFKRGRDTIEDVVEEVRSLNG